MFGLNSDKNDIAELRTFHDIQLGPTGETSGVYYIIQDNGQLGIYDANGVVRRDLPACGR